MIRLLLCISLKTTKALLSQNIFYIKFWFIKEKVLDFETQIGHTVIVNMLADPLTKHLTIGVFQNHVTHMVMVKSFDALC